jgi:hypothetical protein
MKAKTAPKSPNPLQRAVLFGVLSLACLLGAMGVLALILWKAELLVWLGLVGSLHYVVLILLGLFAAGFLVSGTECYAAYTGKVLGGTLKLRGGVVVAALVVVGGFWLPRPASEAFTITVLVHGEAGPHDLVLRNVGVVWMTLGPDRRQERIGDKGQADFKNIPASFRAQEVPVSVEAEGFEMTSPNSNYRLSGPSLNVVLRRKATHLKGQVQNEAGKPVSDAVVTVAGMSVKTDTTGHFELTVPGDRLKPELSLQVDAAGYATWRGTAVPGANDLVVILLIFE